MSVFVPRYGWELMQFEPIIVRWTTRGVRVAWFSYVVLPHEHPNRQPPLMKQDGGDAS